MYCLTSVVTLGFGFIDIYNSQDLAVFPHFFEIIIKKSNFFQVSYIKIIKQRLIYKLIYKYKIDWDIHVLPVWYGYLLFYGIRTQKFLYYRKIEYLLRMFHWHIITIFLSFFCDITHIE